MTVNRAQLRLGGRGFPLDEKETGTAIAAQRFDQAVTRRQIGDSRVVQGERRNDESGTSLAPHDRKIAHPHRVELGRHMIWRGPFRLAHSRQRRVAVVCLHRPVAGLEGRAGSGQGRRRWPKLDLPWVHDALRGLQRLFRFPKHSKPKSASTRFRRLGGS